MKKSIILFALITCLTSCQKQTDVLPEVTSNAQREYTISDITEPYVGRVFNTCNNEWVNITGTVRYYIKESHEDGYYLDYFIDLDKATGIGEITGIVYKGGGKSDGRTRMSEDGTDVKGSIHYNIKFHAQGGEKMNFKQNAKFLMKNNEIKVEFNNEDATCEEIIE